ncbi:hypothetical protein [Actinoplanes sp. TFC3]|uniref:hypothetical protein n=1 Tax=Actinoplanes sp. TFC3 TaxID=1710355 RepID=UPI000ABC3AC4|nr:hypothetical protein [Actinoplanes sp. TFC3]
MQPIHAARAAILTVLAVVLATPQAAWAEPTPTLSTKAPTITGTARNTATVKVAAGT